MAQRMEQRRATGHVRACPAAQPQGLGAFQQDAVRSTALKQTIRLFRAQPLRGLFNMCARYLRLYGFLVVHYKIPVNGMHKTARALTNSRASPLAWAINIKAVATRRAGISPAGIRVCHGSARRDVLGVRPETTRATLWQRPTRCMDNGGALGLMLSKAHGHTEHNCAPPTGSATIVDCSLLPSSGRYTILYYADGQPAQAVHPRPGSSHTERERWATTYFMTRAIRQKNGIDTLYTLRTSSGSGDAVLTNEKLLRVASRRREVGKSRQKPFRG